MSEPNEPLTATDTVEEQLTAYLDGELSEGERAEVEERLARDADYRERLRSLQQAWDMLDQLPQAETNEAFTRTTVELVAVHAEKDAHTQLVATTRRAWWGWAAAVAGIVAALSAGYFLTNSAITNSDRQLIRDLAAIDNIDLYRHAESVAFLRELEQTKLFADDPAGGLSETSATGTTEPLVSPTANFAETWRKVAELPPERKLELDQKQQRFLALEKAEQENLRSLAKQLAGEDQASLRQVAQRYTEWLKTLGPSERSELLAIPAEKRVEKVKSLVKEQQDRQLRHHAGSRLAATDLPVIFDWFNQFMANHEQEFIDLLPSSKAVEYVRGEKDVAKRRVMLMMMSMRFSPEKTRDKLATLVNADNRQKLLDQLSPEAVKEFNAAKEQGQRDLVLRDWIRAAIFARMPDDNLFERNRVLMGMNPPVSHEELQRFLKSDRLGPKERDRLESLPPEKMEEELRALYHQQRWRQGFGDKFNGPPRGPGSGPGTGPDDRRRFEGRPPPDDSETKLDSSGSPPRGSPGTPGRPFRRPPADDPAKSGESGNPPPK